ncbi:MAG: hypothetical protein E7264_04205 [Lachnospiraceae bacterium]|nr:hypothetical protein [Lachnospiraceae bacterium]
MIKKCIQLVSYIMVFVLLVGLCGSVPAKQVQATSVEEGENLGEDTGNNTGEDIGDDTGDDTEEDLDNISISLETDKKTLIVNETFLIKPSISPEDTQVTLVYESNNEEVAKVDESGLVTAVGEGETTVIVSAKEDPSVTAVFTLQVLDVPVGLSFDKTAHVLKATDCVTLQPEVTYASGKSEPMDASKVTFVSLHPAVAIVDETGKVTALEQATYPQIATIEGAYTFSYEADGETIEKTLTSQCQITVTMIPVEDVVLLNKEDKVTLKINDQYALDVQILPANATNKGVTYSTSNNNVAQVNSEGVITAKSIGEAVITVESKENPELKKTFQVKVYQTVFNVAQLGANGTDTKSDASAINKVLAYAKLIDEPIIVVVPNGTYYIDKILTIYSDTSLCLQDKAIIKRKSSAGGKVMLRSSIRSSVRGYEQCKNITITGGTWDGNANGSKDANCIYIGHAQNVMINNTIVKNGSGAHLIELAGVKNAIVENVELYGYKKCKEKGYTALQSDKEAIQLDYCSSTTTPAMKPHDLTACVNVTIRNCTIHDYMSGIGSHGSLPDVYLKNIRIENNRFENITNACISLMNYKNVNVSNNKASGFTTFLYASGSDGSIKNNDAKNKSFKKITTSGLRAANGITVSNGSDFTVQKNVIEKATSNGITVWNGSKAVIKSNKIKKSKLYGIRTQGSNITLKSNKFSGNKKGVYDTYKDAKVVSSDDIRAYYVNVKKSYKYNGKPVKPKIKLKNLKKKYYKVTYKNNRRPGTATVIIKGKGKVKQTLKIKYKIQL